MRHVAKLGTSVTFESGGVKATGIVKSFYDGRIFVEADRLVPIGLAQGTPKEHIYQGNRLWLKVPGGVVIKDRYGLAECITWENTE